MIKKSFTALYADENKLYVNEDSGNAVFNCNGIGILNIDLNNINLDNNFGEDDPDTIIFTRLLAWHIKFEKHKVLKNELSEELMTIRIVKVRVCSIQYGGTETFCPLRY